MGIVLRLAMAVISAGLLPGAGTPARQQSAEPGGLTLVADPGPVEESVLQNPWSDGWMQLPSRRLALNRTPRLFESDPPAALEIPDLEVQTVRAAGKLMLRLAWRDSTEDAAEPPAAPASPPEERTHKALTESTARFFDAAAVMFPSDRTGGPMSPSLQMGDPAAPVTIYYWNAVQGASVMEARGRETTSKTGKSFPVQSGFRRGEWSVAFELPDLPPGTPLAFAVWNGSQLDRDGRKYFTVWHRLE